MSIRFLKPKLRKSAGESSTSVPSLALGAELEPAGPLHMPGAGPTTRQERISSMDILRGIAVMGILAVNITDFAGQGMAGAVLSLPSSEAASK